MIGAQPSGRDRRRPWELVGMSAIIGVVIGVLVFFGVRRVMESLIWAGVAFIVALVGIAMLALTTKPELPPEGEQRRVDEQQAAEQRATGSARDGSAGADDAAADPPTLSE